MIVKRNTDYSPDSSRYTFDFDKCQAKHGWAQVDTCQDASYFGIWTNPLTLEIVSYTEGDICHQQAENPEEYVEALRELKAWNDRMGFKCAIDTMMNDRIHTTLGGLDLLDLVHESCKQ